MTKIYCKNCKHFNYSVTIQNEYRCYFKITDETDDKIKSSGIQINEGSQIYTEYDKFNENNDCKYYKRKWYKFWIKT